MRNKIKLDKKLLNSILNQKAIGVQPTQRKAMAIIAKVYSDKSGTKVSLMWIWSRLKELDWFGKIPIGKRGRLADVEITKSKAKKSIEKIATGETNKKQKKTKIRLKRTPKTTVKTNVKTKEKPATPPEEERRVLTPEENWVARSTTDKSWCQRVYGGVRNKY